MAVKFWLGNGGNKAGDWSQATNWYTNGTPQPGDLVIDQTGNIDARDIGITGSTIVWLDEVNYSGPTLFLDGSSTGNQSTVFLNSTTGTARLYAYNSDLGGEIFAGSGTSALTILQGGSATNFGWIGVASYGAPTTLNLGASGWFGNSSSGMLDAGKNGTLTMTIGSTAAPYMWTAGTMQADPGGTFNVVADGTAPNFDGEVLNLGRINANGGSMVLTANVTQSSAGSLNVTNNGTLTLNGATDGGLVQIQSGTLNFGTDGGIGFIGAKEFASTIDFTGNDATLEFGSAVNEVYNPSSNTLAVYAGSDQSQIITTLHLGTNRAYSASDFSASGTHVTFTAHSS